MSWDSDEIFTIYLDNLVYLPYLKDCDKLFFKIAIYHGQEIVTHNKESERFDLEKLGKVLIWIFFKFEIKESVILLFYYHFSRIPHSS